MISIEEATNTNIAKDWVNYDRSRSNKLTVIEDAIMKHKREGKKLPYYEKQFEKVGKVKDSLLKGILI